jgi:clan AA aspartic protease
MGIVQVQIKITNVDDMALWRKDYIKKEDIRSITVTAIADSGAYMMAINQTVKEQLGLSVVDKQKAQLADSSVLELEVVGPIEIRFANRRTVCEAIVLPGDSEILLGAIPMEAMDVLIHPKDQQLIVNPAHPIMPQLSLK